jgi:hypothetical protein
VPGAVLGRGGLVGQPLDGVAQLARVPVVLEHTRDLLRRHGVGRIDAARLLQRLHRVEGPVQARVLHLRQRQPQGHLLRAGRRLVDARVEGLCGQLPPARLLLQPRLEGARGRMRRVLVEHLADELHGAGGIGLRQRSRRASAQRQARRPVRRDTRLVEERARERPRVPHARGGALEAEQRGPAVLLQLEGLLVGARGPGRIAEQLLPEERHLLHVGHLAAHVARLLGRLRVELHQRARPRVDRLREDR